MSEQKETTAEVMDKEIDDVGIALSKELSKVDIKSYESKT